MSIALTGGTVLTSLDPPSIVVADVAIEDGAVTSVGRAPDGVNRIDCTGCLVVPGNVNAHMHLYSALARGMPYRLDPPNDFVQILQRVWWRLDRALDAGSIRASALAGGMDAVLTGTTTLVDHHASPEAVDGSLDVIAQALGDIGLRSVLCYEVTDRDGPERAAAGLEENRRFLKAGWPLARGMVGAHASFTLSDETLGACAEVARDAGVGVHIHVAEDAADQRDAEARFGSRVVPRLARTGVLNGSALLAHCVHVDAEEIDAIGDAGATVAHNPRSNMNNSVGRAPVGALGDVVALGTDGIGADMFAESATSYWRRREESLDAPVTWPLARLARGAAFAGRAFGQPALGRIEPGAPADLVVLEYPDVTPLDEPNVAGHWLFGMGSHHVRDVMVAGEMVVADRLLTRLDQDEVAARAREQAERLWRRIDELPAHPFGPGGGS
ncbi:MAG: chlorohydrolase [Actinobacteria bacterium]|nr:MAG: chlorohydrolase [Actinomycetota bacterium]